LVKIAWRKILEIPTSSAILHCQSFFISNKFLHLKPLIHVSCLLKHV
jgi:hypothetical protein